jgi:hypothetical protein
MKLSLKSAALLFAIILSHSVHATAATSNLLLQAVCYAQVCENEYCGDSRYDLKTKFPESSAPLLCVSLAIRKALLPRVLRESIVSPRSISVLLRNFQDDTLNCTPKLTVVSLDDRSLQRVQETCPFLQELSLSGLGHYD